MQVKLTQSQYDAFKSGAITNSFDELDINDDNMITNDDLSAAKDESIKKDIETLLQQVDEDTELKEFSLDEINKLIDNKETPDVVTTSNNETVDVTNIEGYQDVDISNINNESKATLQTKLTQVNNNISLINQQLVKIINEKQNNQKELEKLEAEKKEKEEALNAANADVQQKQIDLNDEIIAYDNVKQDLETVNNQIRIRQELEEEAYEKHIGDIAKEAAENYNPEEHGDDFEAYFLQQLAQNGYVIFSGLTSLNQTAQQLQADTIATLNRIQLKSAALAQAIDVADVAKAAVDAIDSKIKIVQDKIAKNDADIQALNTMLTNEKNKKSSIEAVLAKIKQQEEEEAKKRRGKDPLAFDIDGDGINTTDEKVLFDIDGDGEKDLIDNSAEWTLAFDKDKDGIAGEDGSELFGDNTDFDGDGIADGYQDGFEALKVLAQREGLISDGDNTLDTNDLKILEEKYGLVMKQGYTGETKSLNELGIKEINIATNDERTLVENFDGKGNDLMTQVGATFVVNGETRQYADIWNQTYDQPTQNKIQPVSNFIPKPKSSTTQTSNNKYATLSFNLSGTQAIQGKVDYDAIKMDALNNPNIFNTADEKKKENEKQKQKEEENKAKEI